MIRVHRRTTTDTGGGVTTGPDQVCMGSYAGFIWGPPYQNVHTKYFMFLSFFMSAAYLLLLAIVSIVYN